ncbi:cell wall hydrolase [Methylorubrum extorquens]|uniref:cell wall hydrolase n=1 Tax=Methylorubrum extorquens TaxID=408 RepID=UPI001EE535E6|nr:cell wall hydrolase [Methylorubrum extorquens]MCG5249060.1 cell wall hydrolase [Methylorubrum extorquens]
MIVYTLRGIPASSLEVVFDDIEYDKLVPKKRDDPDKPGAFIVEAHTVELADEGDAGDAPDEGDAGDAPDEGDAGGAIGGSILKIAKRHVGQKYGPKPPDYDEPYWKGEFDCAELASYCTYRAYGILFGTRPRGIASRAESYTVYWKEDAHAFSCAIPWQDALKTAGAFILRYPPGSGKKGHIAICVGDGDSIYEAHSTNKGVIRGSARGRRWDIGVKLPGVSYANDLPVTEDVFVYRYMDPPRGYDAFVEEIQRALHLKGYLTSYDVSGIYDYETSKAVARFQEAEGIREDGEVGQETGPLLVGQARWEAVNGLVGATAGIPTAKYDLLVLGRTLYGEARGESVHGREAVAHVVLNRMRSSRYPNSIARVCLQPLQFSCWNTNDPNYSKIRSLKPNGGDIIFDECMDIAARVVNGSVADPTGGAMHYHALSIAAPSWVRKSPKARVSAKIGNHIFYIGIS